jgi:DNA modification methylase
MKPIELVERAIRNSSSQGDLVYDPFGGSGTTIIASERLKRRCYLVEISPAYCDVIIERWESYTGKKAERVS